ncbi:MAG: hypothetical protein ING54_01980, partial [Rhodocyclaceae bacterium]|nr:hypothetical protein [Rhodocyclaceae bacterium]
MNYPLSLRHQVFGQGLATGSAFIWLMFFSTLAHCQQISVLVIPEQGTFLADNVELRVVLSNASKDQQVALEDVTIMPIGVLQVLYKSTPVTFATSSSGGIVVPPGGSADGRVTLVPNADWSRRLVSLALLPSR